MVRMVQRFFSNGYMLSELNYNFIALIPKLDSQTKISQYRPISLCNVSYKIIFKILANRLKRVLPKLISPTKNAFVPNRHIQDNLILVHEVMQIFKRKMRLGGLLAIKVDMEKAYDKVDWGFLKEIMRVLGFCAQWRQ